MNTEKPIYEISLSETNEVYAISLVDKPANQTEFMLFSETDVDNVKLSTYQDKQIVTGVVLIPNQPIMRSYGVLKFTEPAIEDLSIKFFESGFQTNSNFQHDQEDNIDDLVFFESWIVNDPLNDKANALGFKNLIKGTWMVSAKIKNPSTWERLKSGEAKGFSIEGFLNKQLKLSLDENIKTNINNNQLDKKEMNLLKELTSIFTKLSATELSETELELTYTVGDQLENKGVEYSFEENGYKIEVNAEGIITSITEVVVEEVPLDTPITMTVEADIAAEIISADTEQIDAEVEKPVEVVDIEALKKLIEDLKAQVDVLEAEKAKLALSVEKLSEQPNTLKLSANQVPNRKETRLETLARLANQ